MRGLTQDGAGWRVEAEGGNLRAGRVVVATDAYGHASGYGIGQAVAGEQVILPYFDMATRPLPPEVAAGIVPGRQGVWDTKEVLSSFRFDAQNRLVFGSVGALRAGGLAVHSAWARRARAPWWELSSAGAASPLCATPSTHFLAVRRTLCSSSTSTTRS